jgi:hypothetical protein
MPAITAADALIRAADSLTDAIDRANPKPGMTKGRHWPTDQHIQSTDKKRKGCSDGSKGGKREGTS